MRNIYFLIVRCYLSPILFYEDPPADGIVFVLQRAVDLAVFLVDINAAKVADQALHAANQVTRKIGLDQLGGKGIVHVSVFCIHRNALTMACAEISRKNAAWQIHPVRSFHEHIYIYYTAQRRESQGRE